MMAIMQKQKEILSGYKTRRKFKNHQEKAFYMDSRQGIEDRIKVRLNFFLGGR